MSKKPNIPDNLKSIKFDWQKLAPYCSRATLALARYDGTLDGIVNPAVLLSPITNREAVLSSRIEGTQASLIEVLQHEAGKEYDEDKRGDIKEIINYRKALLLAEKHLDERDISLHLIRELHNVLMENVRGGDKTPGKFRDEQNWIGKVGCTIEEARFVPPEPIVMHAEMDSLQKFICSEYDDPIVQLAMIHAQFEIIHPFNDGNGRLGRMLIPLFLSQKKVLQRPSFYLSEYLEENDKEYRDRLLAITEQGNWQAWVEFFLNAVFIQAQRNTEKSKKIHKLYEDMKISFAKITKSQYAQTALDAFFTRPIINSTDFLKISRIDNRGTANSILRDLASSNIIKVLKKGAGQSPSIYSFPKLINTSEGRDVEEI